MWKNSQDDAGVRKEKREKRKRKKKEKKERKKRENWGLNSFSFFFFYQILSKSGPKLKLLLSAGLTRPNFFSPFCKNVKILEFFSNELPLKMKNFYSSQ